MKKAVALLLAVIMVFALCACGKSEAVVVAEETIKSIGEVSIDSWKAIEDAEKKYEFLTENEKEKVENRLALVEAREKYDKLVSDTLIDLQKEFEITLDVYTLMSKAIPIIFAAAEDARLLQEGLGCFQSFVFTIHRYIILSHF